MTEQERLDIIPENRISSRILNLSGIPATPEQKRHNLIDIDCLDRLLEIYGPIGNIAGWTPEIAENYYDQKIISIVTEFITPFIANKYRDYLEYIALIGQNHCHPIAFRETLGTDEEIISGITKLTQHRFFLGEKIPNNWKYRLKEYITSIYGKEIKFISHSAIIHLAK